MKAGQAGFAQNFFHIQLQVQPPGSHLTPRLGGTHGNFPSTSYACSKKTEPVFIFIFKSEATQSSVPLATEDR